MRRSVADLERRKRPQRERRLPDVDLHIHRHNLAHFEQQADRLDREITALRSNHHRRASHLAAHCADQTELEAIGNVLDERIRQNTNRAVADPPSYITKILGAPPTRRIQTVAPNLGRLAYRAQTEVDGRGRVVLDRRVRAWLAVEKHASFEVVSVPASEGGSLVVPIEDFAPAGR